MPPKKNWTLSEYPSLPCDKKTTTKLSTATKESSRLLKKALENTYISEDGPSYFEYFKDLDWPNECIFSYPDSNWIAIYLKDSSGNVYWSKNPDGSVKNEKVYFQIGFDSESDPEIINFTKRTPSELEGLQNCAVVNGKCVNGNREPKAQKPGKKVIFSESIPERIIPPVESVASSSKSVPKVNNTTKNTKTTKSITREEFEKMGSKEAIINWMIQNMDPKDILSCLQQDKPSGINDIIEGMDTLEIVDTLTEVSFEDLVEGVNSITNLEERYSRIVDLCVVSGLYSQDDFDIIKSKKHGFQLSLNDNIQSMDDINELLEKCAKREAMRLANKFGNKINK